mmetsp:Transcript_67042/g.212186  ORF Transcript_67042/g.212186 Transcript_67042/m.212186 type:complete len:201 (+) Transcript_67042:86-688(+)
MKFHMRALRYQPGPGKESMTLKKLKWSVNVNPLIFPGGKSFVARVVCSNNTAGLTMLRRLRTASIIAVPIILSPTSSSGPSSGSSCPSTGTLTWISGSANSTSLKTSSFERERENRVDPLRRSSLIVPSRRGAPPPSSAARAGPCSPAPPEGVAGALLPNRIENLLDRLPDMPAGVSPRARSALAVRGASVMCAPAAEDA